MHENFSILVILTNIDAAAKMRPDLFNRFIVLDLGHDDEYSWKQSAMMYMMSQFLDFEKGETVSQYLAELKK